MPKALPHGLRAMTGRDPREPHRAATPLELLYDLTIVVAFSISGSQAAHAVAAGHVLPAIVAFTFSIFAIVWAWLNYTWFASAFDNDDWVMRLATLVQMVGVVVLSLGLADIYKGFDHWQLNNRVMVLGYVLMRVSMVALWLRAARDNPERAGTLRLFALFITIAQVGWIIVGLTHLPRSALVPLLLVLYALEVGGVVAAERRSGGTPWHPHHIAERYSLLVLIALGEVVLGTTMAVESLVSSQGGWSLDAAMVAGAGIGLAFGLWWSYFGIPFGEVLEKRQGDRGFSFAYGHLPLYAAITAMGAGLHVASYFVAGESALGARATVLTIAVPMLLFVVVVFALVHRLMPGRDRFHVLLMALCTATSLGAVALASGGAPLWACLVLLMITPWVLVIGYETRGHAHMDRRLAELGTTTPAAQH